jgi:hypothetical protein
LSSFSLTKSSIMDTFNSHITVRQFVSKISIIDTCQKTFLALNTSFLAFSAAEVLFSTCFAKLRLLSDLESELFVTFQQKCTVLFLYPLIFQTAKNNTSLLSVSRILPTTESSYKVSILKTIF